MSEIRVDTISEKTSANGVSIDGVTIKDGGITATTGSIVFNEASADVDFRVESNGNANMLFVDGGNDKVGIGTNSLTGTFHVLSSNAGTTMYIEDSHAGDGDGPELYLYRSSASPADNDSIGIMKFLGRNDNSQDVIYGQMQSIILDASDGTEDAKTVFNNMVGGSSLNMLQFDNTGVIINESSNDLDFRVESNDNANMLFVDGGNNVVGIGTATPVADARLTISSADNTSNIFLERSGSSQFDVAVVNQGGAFQIKGGSNQSTVAGLAEWLKIDGNTGAVTKPLQPAFQVHPASTQTNIASDTTIAFGTERFDLGADFASNTFTAPVTGKYQMNVLLRLEDIDTAYSYFRIYLNTSNKQYEWLMDPNFSADLDYLGVGFSILVDMDASDTSTVAWEQGGGANQVDISSASMWTGFLVC